MSYANGLAALNLEMTKRVAMEEFDADRHWSLVSAVTGIRVDENSPQALQRQASTAFVQAWNYDLMLGAVIHVGDLGSIRTDMGHGVYEQGGSDLVATGEPFFKTVEQAMAFDPLESLPRLDKQALIRRFQESRDGTLAYGGGDLVPTTGTYITLLTGFIYMFGWEMLLEVMGTDAARFGEQLNRYRQWMQQYYDALAESDVQVIYSHDDIVWSAGAFCHPDFYRKYIFPNLKKLYEPVIAAGKKIIFLSDGDYTEFFDDLVATGAHGFFMEPYCDMALFAEKHGKNKVFVGNCDTRVLLRNHKPEIKAMVERVMSIGKKYPGFVFGCTNMIPHNTPVDAAIYYHECYLKNCMR